MADWAPCPGAGFHLPSHVSDFGKGHTLDLAYIMEERRHELAYLHRQENTLAQPGVRGQVSIQPVITPGETMIIAIDTACCASLWCSKLSNGMRQYKAPG